VLITVTANTKWQTYVLTRCRRSHAAGKVGALVVVPSGLEDQWMEEIVQHSNLSVLHYTGINRHIGPEWVD
jgi:hypothetical protein